MNAPTYEQLQAMTDTQLIDAYDNHTRNTVVGLQWISDELHRRARDRESASVRKLAVLGLVVSIISAVAAIAAVVLSILTLWATS